MKLILLPQTCQGLLIVPLKVIPERGWNPKNPITAMSVLHFQDLNFGYLLPIQAHSFLERRSGKLNLRRKGCIMCYQKFTL
jgi:hypothetical protein